MRKINLILFSVALLAFCDGHVDFENSDNIEVSQNSAIQSSETSENGLSNTSDVTYGSVETNESQVEDMVDSLKVRSGENELTLTIVDNVSTRALVEKLKREET